MVINGDDGNGNDDDDGEQSSCHLNEKRIKEKLSVWGTRTCQSVVCFDDALAIKGW